MKYPYTPETKNQKDNPFCKMRKNDAIILREELLTRLLWVNQLGSSRNDYDKQVYDLLANTPSKKDWGSAPHYNNASNTGMAILSGAIEKLARGDLSLKQVERVNTICEVLHRAYPKKWGELVLEPATEIDVNARVSIETLFEFL